MSAIQKFFQSILPPRWAESMEAESRSWKVRCACGAETSIWELGGIRLGAAGQPKRYLICPKCGQASWQTVSRERPDERPDGVGGQ